MTKKIKIDKELERKFKNLDRNLETNIPKDDLLNDEYRLMRLVKGEWVMVAKWIKPAGSDTETWKEYKQDECGGFDVRTVKIHF
jgi:carboxylesterase type B